MMPTITVAMFPFDSVIHTIVMPMVIMMAVIFVGKFVEISGRVGLDPDDQQKVTEVMISKVWSRLAFLVPLYLLAYLALKQWGSDHLFAWQWPVFLLAAGVVTFLEWRWAWFFIRKIEARAVAPDYVRLRKILVCINLGMVVGFAVWLPLAFLGYRLGIFR